MVTRETKIGLIVGLVFIIGMGILISEYLSNMMRPPTPKADVKGNVDKGTTTLGNSSGRSFVYHPPEDVTPGTALGPSRTDGPRTGTGDISRGTTGGATGGGAAGGNTGGRTSGTDVLPPPGGTTVIPPRGSQEDGTGDVEAPPGTKNYVVKPGQTLMAISKEVLGSSSQGNRDKIVKLNPTLQKDNGARLSVNQIILVPDPNYRGTSPVLGGGPIHARDTGPDRVIEPGRIADPARTPEAGRPSSGVTEATNTSHSDYKTQPGDTLWKIARDQCGDASSKMVEQIKALNKDLLKGKDAIQPNMTLKIPAKSVASR